MSDCMTFPNTVEEFMEQYKVVDTDCVYSNGIEFVPIFRMKQWFEHLQDAQEVQPDRMKLVQQAVNTIMSMSRSYSIRDRAFRNAARLVQCAIDGEAPDFEQIPEGDEMPSEQRWIPVDLQNNSPEENKVVLLGVRYRDDFKYFVTSRQDYNYWTGLGREIKGELRWQPLPEPYREEGEE